MLAFLFEKDPAPLIRILGLPDGVYWCRREAPAAKGRLDLIVYRAELPVAVLEIKGASREHGDQLDRYQAWAAKQNPEAALFYCSPDRDDTPRKPWRAVGLAELFEAWQSSSDPHATWLAGEITNLLRSWDKQAEGIIGHANGWYVPDLVTRRIGRQLDGVLRHDHPGDGQAKATRTTVGNPMFLAWRRYPGGSGHAWIGVDVRCKGRGNQQAAWEFRPCVEAEEGDQPETAMIEAHDLACALYPAMLHSAIKKMLDDRGLSDLAKSLSPTGTDGLVRAPDAAILAGWRSAVQAGTQPRRHPVFRNDWNRRLATSFVLHVDKVDRTQLAELTLAVLDHLVKYAAPDSPPRAG
ncbi:PD-(D/E)XK nuclease family protein [Actinoplanes italicus]|uniref:PD-(D/E)XK nuclease family protein n=1 Tax=Actinoplanes italicus TaxID=113567 RepID=UPI0011B21064|nr:PD-(D/E)XK nuclease family protein [Actinoplanes italicus]